MWDKSTSSLKCALACFVSVLTSISFVFKWERVVSVLSPLSLKSYGGSHFGFPCNFSSNWQTKRGFFFPIIDLFPLRVRFSLLKCLLWEKHCNYLMTTTQGDRFASCENIVSRSKNSSSPPPPHREGWWNTSINYVGWYVVAQILPVSVLFYFVSNQLTYRRQTKTKLN